MRMLVVVLLVAGCSSTTPSSTYSVNDASADGAADGSTDATATCPALGAPDPNDATLSAARASACGGGPGQVIEQSCGVYTEIESWGIDTGVARFYDTSGALVGTAGLSGNTGKVYCTGGVPSFVLPPVDKNGRFVCTNLGWLCLDGSVGD
ncbi:hypothetical protein BH09MYX1_BH09MYX1_29790 [soil metagenome]